jgi:molybdopterin/thiamine biosynthesis adenylyltransferase/nitroreductase
VVPKGKRGVRPARVEDPRALAELKATCQVFDTIPAQLAELVRARDPCAADVDGEVRRILGEKPDAYGTWFHYGWSGRLVRVLPRADFVLLRTSRNRNKITSEEQARLASLAIGIVGLSVGSATALTLFLEGIGGQLRLADYDTLAVSNLNRLRAGLHEIGMNKAVITARAIWEIDPYADVVLFTDGINDDNIETFLSGLDVLIEECDDLAMKIRLREQARARRIPVVMETNDRGMLDVERFDLEPDRPILHGLVGNIQASAMRGLTTAEKVPFVLAIIGDVSPRAAASMVDIDTTLETWPQLASAVSLGAAINADTVRRIALGTFRDSGRFYVDLERIVGQPEDRDDSEPLTIQPHANEPLGSKAAPEIEAIVRLASLAPSGGNCQPWRFVADDASGNVVLECWHAQERSESLLDFEGRAAHLALGAALENARLACRKMELRASIKRLPAPGIAWTLHMGADGLPRTPDDEALASAIEQRVTNRKLAARQPLPDGVAEALVRVAESAGARLDLLTAPDAMARAGEIIARGEKLRILHPVLHREMMREVRWTPEEAERTKDGLDLATLELGAADAAGLQLLRSPAIARTIRRVRGGEGLKKLTRKAVAAASAIGLVRVGGVRDLLAHIRGGEVVQRVWLYATSRGLAVQPLTAVLYLVARLEDGGAEGFDERDRVELEAIRNDLDDLFGAFDGARMMVMRFAVTGPPSARSLRRPVGAILSAR